MIHLLADTDPLGVLSTWVNGGAAAACVALLGWQTMFGNPAREAKSQAFHSERDAEFTQALKDHWDRAEKMVAEVRADCRGERELFRTTLKEIQQLFIDHVKAMK